MPKKYRLLSSEWEKRIFMKQFLTRCYAIHLKKLFVMYELSELEIYCIYSWLHFILFVFLVNSIYSVFGASN